jgi:hypothetical protein
VLVFPTLLTAPLGCLLQALCSLLFRKEHIELPVNDGEKRESLIILEKVGLIEGLLKKLGTEALVSPSQSAKESDL